jgi:hypothetical protein
MFKKYLSTLLFLFPLLIFSQKSSVKGTVNDKDDNPGIATVRISGPSLKNDEGAQTDEQGSFAIQVPPGTYIITITQQSHRDFVDTIIVEKDKNVNMGVIRLKEAPVELSVYEVKDKTHTTNAVVSVITITKEDIQRIPATMGEADIVGALLVTPGVVSSGDQGGQLYIRGGPPIQNKVYMDGAVIYNPFHSIGILSVFDTDLIRSADIYTGGFGAQYGGRISSVMDIHMRDGNRRKFSGKVGITPISSKLILEGPIKRQKESGGSSASFLLNARGSFLEYSSRIFYPYANVTNVNSATVGLPYNFWDIYGKISINAGDEGSKVNLFGFSHNDIVNFSNITKLNWSSAGGGLNFVVVPGNANVRIDGAFAYSNYQINMVEQNELSLKRESSVNGFNVNLNFHQFFGNNKITYGLEAIGSFTHLYYDTPYSTHLENDNNTTEIAAFARAKINKWGFVFEPSVRIHYYASLGEVSPEPRLSLKYNIRDWWRVKAAGGLYSQNLVAANSDRDVVNLFYGFLSGVENIPSTFRGDKVTSRLSRSQHGIIGMEFDLGKYIDLNVEGYIMNFSQLLNVNRNKQYDEGTQPAGTPDYLVSDVIVETGYATGFDATLKFEYTTKNKLHHFYIWTVYSFLKTQRTDEVQSYTPHFARQHNLNMLGAYNFGKNKDWEVSVRWNLGSGFPFTQTQGFYEFLDFGQGINTDYTTNNGTLGLQYAGPNSGELPWYHRLDINFKRTITFYKKTKESGKAEDKKQIGKMEINVGGSNLYNRKNIFYLDRVTFQKIYQLPIIYNVGVTFEW